MSSKSDQMKTSPENGAFQGAARQMAVLWEWDFGEALNSFASYSGSYPVSYYSTVVGSPLILMATTELGREG